MNPSASNNFADTNRDIIRRRKNNLADFTQTLTFTFTDDVPGRDRVVHEKGRLNRVQSIAQQSQPADDLHSVWEKQIVTSRIRIARTNRLFQLSQRYIKSPQSLRVRLNFVTFDIAAKTDDIRNSRYSPEFAVQCPVLLRFQIGQRIDRLTMIINGISKKVTVDFPGRRRWCNLGLNARWQIRSS